MQPQRNMSIKQWFQNENNALLLLYSDVSIIVENWQFHFIFCSIELVYWILYRKIWLDLKLELTNVIQQNKTVFTMFLLLYKVWDPSYVQKTIDKLDTLYEAWISKEASCAKTSSNVTFYELFLYIIYVTQCISYYSLYFLFNFYIV